MITQVLIICLTSEAFSELMLGCGGAVQLLKSQKRKKLLPNQKKKGHLDAVHDFSDSSFRWSKDRIVILARWIPIGQSWSRLQRQHAEAVGGNGFSLNTPVLIQFLAPHEWFELYSLSGWDIRSGWTPLGLENSQQKDIKMTL